MVSATRLLLCTEYNRPQLLKPQLQQLGTEQYGRWPLIINY